MIPQRRHFEMIWFIGPANLIQLGSSQIQQCRSFSFKVQQTFCPVLEHIEVHLTDVKSLAYFVDQTLFLNLEGTVSIAQLAQVNQNNEPTAAIREYLFHTL